MALASTSGPEAAASGPAADNFADRDPALRPLLDRLLSEADRRRIEPVLHDLGQVAAGELARLAAIADANPPRLRQYDAAGERVDEVEYHPAYARMSQLAFERFGLAALSHRPGVLGWPAPAPHVVKYALSYVFAQAEFGLLCPVSMTDSAARVLRLFDSVRFAPEIAALSSPDLRGLATGAMFMTERQGGTDIAMTGTEATRHGSHWTLRGQKWFASNVTADVILTLARVPGQGEGTKGLGMFLVPRLRPDGSRNSYLIDRLKDKLGARSMASGEVTLEDAHALSVGEPEHGFRQMAEMLNVSRLSNAMRSAGLMRRAVRESVDHTRQRVVFGRPLFDQPLMRATLLPLIVDTEAALGLVLESAARLDDADAGDAEAGRLVRVLTPLAKYSVCKQARAVTAEAMEVRGGNGYIEDWVNPRLLRDAHLGSIWEGSSNVIALDVLRCLRQDGSHRLLADVYRRRLHTLDDPEVRPAADILDRRWNALAVQGELLLAGPVEEQQADAGGFAEATARTVMASLLLEQAAYEAGSGLGHRKLLVAHTYLSRLDPLDRPDRTGGPAPMPASAVRSALAHLGELAEGGPVGIEAARAALETTPGSTHA
ncbi:acyl-CoA dehydrogenase family protein [Streptacidiphilus sp. EB129]|uniref:acyl-CoA dehydrogenase family protein n=1 Tax=Streptacidiphilus sp. EB129 TaxID=3156262 RepID=UPI003511BA9D